MSDNFSKYKVVIIGLDGATWDIIKPLVARGKLPHLAEIMKSGVHGELESTIHPITPQAWSSFLTGKNAGKHGIYDFTAWKPGTYNIEFVNAGRRCASTIFRLLSDSGKRVGSIAVPFTFPPEEVSGFMLSGMDAPVEDARAVYPPELYRELRQQVGPYYIHLGSPVGRKVDVDGFCSDVFTEDENRTQISQYLMKHYPVDLFMTVYNNIDRAQHQFFTQKKFTYNGRRVSGLSLIEEIYQKVDEHLGQIKSQLDSNTVLLVMSDHGAGPIKRVFFLNRWLEKQKLLYYRTRNNSISFQLTQKARAWAKRWLPRGVKNFLKGQGAAARDRLESYLLFSDIDWEHTRAYGFGMYGNIYLNLKGREPQGIVEPGAESEELCSQIIEQLGSLTDPDTGEKIVERIYRREELYHGPHLDKAPDLLIKWKDYAYYTSVNSENASGDIFGPSQNIDSSEYLHIGTHRLNGIFMATGDIIKKGIQIKGAQIIDLAPTILYIMDQPIPDDMDGKVLRELFDPAFLQAQPPRFKHPGEIESENTQVKYTPEEINQIEARLKGLGYIE